MSNIVTYLKKHQKHVVLIAAIGIIALYMIPFDLLAQALPGGHKVNVNDDTDKEKDKCDKKDKKNVDDCYRILG